MIQTEQIVVIKDKFPKAKHHFLVIPKILSLENPFSLTKNNIALVKEMNLLARNAIELVGEKIENFMIGFHAEPSMIR